MDRSSRVKRARNLAIWRIFPRRIEGPMSDHRLRIYESILELLSSEDNPTPLVRLNKVVPYRHTQVYAKLEWYNPFGAVKDRIAANLLDDAEKRGVITAGTTTLV